MVQSKDPIISKVKDAHLSHTNPPRGHEWQLYPLRRYVLMWTQLRNVEGVLYRQFMPNLLLDAVTVVTVPILPASMQQQALNRNHDAPTAGHLGSEKTLQRLRQEAYWVTMANDVVRYCQQCTKVPTDKATNATTSPPHQCSSW